MCLHGPVPRKPTKFALDAKAGLEKMAAALGEGTPLPALARLGEKFSIHPSTALRILRDLAQEGLCWQSPSGRFYSAASRRRKLRSAPICFVGRELWRWSRLYQEILEGVSEVAAANGSPLVALTAPSLVKQSSPGEAPRFARRASQTKELAVLLAAAPKACAGFILDHLWSPGAISSARWPGGQRVQLLCGNSEVASVVRADFAWGAEQVAGYARSLQASKVLLVLPFSGDPAIDLSAELLEDALAGFELSVCDFAAIPEARDLRDFSLIVCPEDNVALAISERIARGGPPVIGTQGTGILQAPYARLRYDYRRLGRSAAAEILTGEESGPFRPSFIRSPEAKA